jgi:tetratricopeptide (TPR) repeat protein
MMSVSLRVRLHMQPRESSEPSHADIARQLSRILADAHFQNSRRLSRFLRFAVEQRLSGHADGLKEHWIGVEVFDRGPDYNPQTDPIVRIMAGRLRGRLLEYYSGPGSSDAVLIEIPRGGYAPRFRWNFPAQAGADRPAPAAAAGRVAWVGREAELARLHALYEMVCAGGGAAVLITGEAGVGKTTIAERLLDEIARVPPAVWVGRGRCSERSAETDAYAPVFEALESLTHGETGAQARDVMRTTAPAWYAEVFPGGEGDRETGRSASHDRMRRQFVRLFAELAQDRPVVIFLDDLHWADATTCDLLAYLGARLGTMRVLLAMAYRATESSRSNHPLAALRVSLHRAGASNDVPLPPLSLGDTERYLAIRYPRNSFPSGFGAAVHDRTEGNPLFMTDLLRFLQDRLILEEAHGQWVLRARIVELKALIPWGIANMVRVKLDQFPERDRELLLCAAVQGIEFDSTVLARVLERDAAEVEEDLHKLSTAHGYVEMLDEREFSGGVLSLRCRFTHVFYQDVLQSVLAPSRRAEYSVLIARTLVELLGPEASKTAAAQLAMLFETGRDPGAASEYFLRAAGNAARVFGYPEAVLLCRRGLRALLVLPESRERDARELRFSMLLGISLMATEGYGATDAERTHERSRELCLRLGERRRLHSVLWALHTCYLNGGELSRSLVVARQLRDLAEQVGDPLSTIESLHALGTTLAFMGRHEDARRALEEIFRRFPTEQHEFRQSLYVMDPYVTSLSMLARLLTMMGVLAEARRRAAESVELASRLAHPPSLAYARFWVGWIAHATGEYGESLPHLEQVMEWGREHSLLQLLEWARLLHGSSLVHVGRPQDGIRELRESIDAQQSMRSLIERPYCLTLLAEALLCAGGSNAEALALSNEAMSFARQADDLCYQPETYRVRGELRRAERSSSARDDIEQALSLARESGAALLELRAAISLARTLGGSQPRDALTSALERVVGDAPIVREASLLLGI